MKRVPIFLTVVLLTWHAVIPRIPAPAQDSSRDSVSAPALTEDVPTATTSAPAAAESDVLAAAEQDAAQAEAAPGMADAPSGAPRTPPPLPAVGILRNLQSPGKLPQNPVVPPQPLPSAAGVPAGTSPRSVGGASSIPRSPLPMRPLAPAASAVPARPVVPTEIDHPVDWVEVRLEMSGTLKPMVPAEKPTPMTVNAQFAYEEDILEPGDGTAQAVRAVRWYDTASAQLNIGGQPAELAIAPQRRYLAVSIAEGRVEVFSPTGPLTREELDLVDIPGNTAVIDRLLPTPPIGKDTRWQLTPDLLARLLGLDVVTEAEVTAKVAEMQPGGLVRVEFSGKLSGRVLGAGTKQEILGRFQFPLTERRITWLAMLVRENREQGAVDGGFEAVARLQLQRSVRPRPQFLPLDAVAQITFPPLDDDKRLLYRDETAGWQLLHDRRWYLVGKTDELTAFRFVDSLRSVAQCNLAPIAGGSKDVTLTGFQELVRQLLGDRFRRVVDFEERTSPTGHRMFRVHALGSVNDLTIHWIYYLLTAPDGKNYVAVFTVGDQDLALFGEADKDFVAGLAFLQPSDGEHPAQPATAGTPDEAAVSAKPADTTGIK
ncbi:MAG: hypothetical protein ACUVQQ_03080 [Thermogutta sp.]